MLTNAQLYRGEADEPFDRLLARKCSQMVLTP